MNYTLELEDKVDLKLIRGGETEGDHLIKELEEIVFNELRKLKENENEN